MTRYPFCFIWKSTADFYFGNKLFDKKLFTISEFCIIIIEKFFNKELNMDKKNSTMETFECVKTALTVSAALVLFLASASYIIYKSISAYRHNERWKDYDECGLS